VPPGNRGAVSRVDPPTTAVGEQARQVGFDLNVTAGWSPRDPDGERHTAWVLEGWERLAAHAAGVYANFLSDEGTAGVEAAYGERLARLRALKDRCYPANVFRMNANIEPSGRP
jgi:Berberine and berberine like